MHINLYYADLPCECQEDDSKVYHIKEVEPPCPRAAPHELTL